MRRVRLEVRLLLEKVVPPEGEEFGEMDMEAVGEGGVVTLLERDLDTDSEER